MLLSSAVPTSSTASMSIISTQTQDYLNLKFEQHIVQALAQNGNIFAFSFPYIEVILFSTEIQKETMLFFRKKQILMVTNSHMYIVDKNKKYLKKRDDLKKDIIAITQSLMMGQYNMIIHYKMRADAEIFTER